jgi:toxin-antitoxin system PIN domain toxin
VSRVLLDVNVLLALLDADHVEHARARGWLEGVLDVGWASCPITQNGFVRIISQPRYPSPVPPAEAIDLLEQATATSWHEFWPCDVSLLDHRIVDRTRVHGARQVTDAYLLALAAAHGGRFATFDRSVVLSAVPAATVDDLIVI